MDKMQTQFHDPEFMTGWGAGNPLSQADQPMTTEEAAAKGIGSMTTQKAGGQKAEAQGVWKEGLWQVVFSRALTSKEKNDIQFDSGSPVNVSFAVFDGAHKDRNGQKMVSVWNELTLVSSPNVLIGDQLDPRLRGDDVRRS